MDAATFFRWFFAAFFVTLWVGWLAFWTLMARRVKAPAQAESAASRLSHVVPLFIAAYLLTTLPVPIPALDGRFVPLALWPPTLGAALAAAGLAFCVWARLTLSENWSGDVQLKHDHELIVVGPYRWVRHPIYTGILLMFVGTALAVGEWRAIVAILLAAAAFWRKLRLEEALMRRQFGDSYEHYAARVPALIPFLV